jgi:hypothetical protein
VTSEEDIASLIIRDEIRIGQVAKVAFSPEDANSFVRLNGERIVGISVIRQAGSNTVRIADGVRAAVADINTRIEGVDLRISSDDSIFIRGSVREGRHNAAHFYSGGDWHDPAVYGLDAPHTDPCNRHSHLSVGYVGSQLGAGLFDQHPDAAGTGARSRADC